jgi:hypothetical protein
VVFYWSLFIIPALMAFQETARRPKRNLIGLKLFLLFLLLVIGFRETGGDWEQYVVIFERIKPLDFASAIRVTEPGYGFLNWLSARLGTGLYGVNVIGALIYVTGFYKFALRESRPILMLTTSISYLVIVVVMGYSRQGLAIGLLIWGLTYVYDHKPVRYVIMCLLAASLHTTALIMLPLAYFAINFRKNTGLAYIQVSFILLSAVLLYREYNSTMDYMVVNYWQGTRYSSQGALIRSVMNAGAAILFFWNWRKWALFWNDRHLWTFFAIVALAIVPMAYVSSTTADRLGLYIIPLQLVVFSRLPTLQRTKFDREVWTCAPVLGYALSLAVWLQFGQFTSELWLPYRSLIFGVFE